MRKEAKKKLLEKHPPLSPEEIEKKKREIVEARDEYQKETINYEKNLLEYFEKTEPIVDEKGRVLAVMRYPSYDELMNMVPPELRKYEKNPELIPPELEAKYSESHFEIMSKLIVKPNKPPEWWKNQKGIMRFVQLFNSKLAEVITAGTEEAENFRIAPKD